MRENLARSYKFENCSSWDFTLILHLIHEVLHLFHKVLHWIHELFEIWKSRKVSKSLGKSLKVSESFNSRSCTFLSLLSLVFLVFELTLKSFRFFLGNPGVFTITSCKLGVDLERNFLTLRKLFLQLMFLVIVVLAVVYSAIISWELDLILPIFALFLG